MGELAALGDTPRAASVMTLDSSKFAIVPAADIKACLKRNPDLAMGVIQSMAQHIARLTETYAISPCWTFTSASRGLLLKRATEQDGKLVVAPRLSQQEIANHTGASREMVGRVLKELTIGGYIALADGSITIEKKLPLGW